MWCLELIEIGVTVLFSLLPMPAVFKALTMRTVHGRLIFHTWEEIERLVAEGQVDVKKVVSHRFPMSRFEDAFQALFSGQACKILLDPHH